MATDQPHLGPPATPLAHGPRNPISAQPWAFSHFLSSQGSVRAGYFLRDGYSGQLGGQGPCQQHRPRGCGQWVSQFYLKRKGMMKRRTLDGALGSGGKCAVVSQAFFLVL